MIVIKTGQESGTVTGKQTWNGYVPGYFESERHAEKYLIENGYEKDADEIFFKEEQAEWSDIAMITNLEKISVTI